MSQGYADTPFSRFLPTNRPDEAYCPSGLTHCTAHVWGVVTLRGELYDDVDGQRTGFATRYNNWALGWQHWFSPQIEIRPEIAFYHALDKPAFDNGTKHAITIISGDVIWHF